MRSARFVAVCVCLLSLGACRSDSTTDPPANPSPGQLSLAEGDYVLGISLGGLPPPGGNPSLCFSTTPTNLPTTAALPVRVTRSGNAWTVRVVTVGGAGGSLQLTLQPTGARTVSGTATGSGTVNDGSILVTVVSSATLTGSQAIANSVGGSFDGQIQFTVANASITCSTGAWTLTQR